MPSPDERMVMAERNGGRISPPEVRALYESFCAQVARFSPPVEIEAARFETRFTSPAGVRIIVAPYHDIFMVSVGGGSPCEIRVSGEEGYFRALDLALNHFLSINS